MKCPKCGSEMTRWYYVDGWPKDQERFDKLVCNCGHEEKVGEKRHWDDGSPGGVTGGEKK